MFNEAKLRKELRGSSLLLWYRKKEVDYVATGYFSIKLDLNKHRKILGVLVEKFGTMPKPYSCLQWKMNTKAVEESVMELKKPDFIELIDKRKTTDIKDTRLFYKHKRYDNELLGVFKGEDYIYIKSKYLDLINRNCINLSYEGGGKLEPVFISDYQSILMIMPMRMIEDNEFLVKEDKNE